MFNFFQKPFGFNISEQSVKIVLLAGSDINPRLVSMGYELFEKEIISGGKILDKTAFSQKVSNITSKPQFGRIKNRQCIFSLPETNVFSHYLKLPDRLKKEERAKHIKKEIEEVFPFALKDIYFDHILYPDNEAFIVAIPKEIVNDCLAILKSCKIKPVALDIESESQKRAVLQNEDGTVLITDIGDKNTNFFLFDGNKLRLSSSVPIAGSNFTLAIEQKLNISFSEADNLKKKTGLNPNAKEGRVFLILQQEIRIIIEEIKRIDEYALSKLGKQIETIVLTGGSAELPYLSDYLVENLGKKIKTGDPWQRINIDILKQKQYIREASRVNPFLFTGAIGLAQRALTNNPQLSGINLIKEVKY